jgi:hypothetical protein
MVCQIRREFPRAEKWNFLIPNVFLSRVSFWMKGLRFSELVVYNEKGEF